MTSNIIPFEFEGESIHTRAAATTGDDAEILALKREIDRLVAVSLWRDLLRLSGRA